MMSPQQKWTFSLSTLNFFLISPSLSHTLYHRVTLQRKWQSKGQPCVRLLMVPTLHLTLIRPGLPEEVVQVNICPCLSTLILLEVSNS